MKLTNIFIHIFLIFFHVNCFSSEFAIQLRGDTINCIKIITNQNTIKCIGKTYKMSFNKRSNPKIYYKNTLIYPYKWQPKAINKAITNKNCKNIIKLLYGPVYIDHKKDAFVFLAETYKEGICTIKNLAKAYELYEKVYSNNKSKMHKIEEEFKDIRKKEREFLAKIQKNDNLYSNNYQTPLTGNELLRVENWRCYSEYGFDYITGEVTNISSIRLKNVLAVGIFRTEDGTFIKSESSIIEYNPILSGQTSPFTIITTHNPLFKRCSVSFKSMFGGSLSFFFAQ